VNDGAPLFSLDLLRKAPAAPLLRCWTSEMEILKLIKSTSSVFHTFTFFSRNQNIKGRREQAQKANRNKMVCARLSINKKESASRKREEEEEKKRHFPFFFPPQAIFLC